ncbi:MAG: hypothetical protein ACO3QN_03005 [Bacilli bacterium]
MPRANTGKIIEAITVKRKRILIAFLSGETLTLTPDQYTQDYFYVGKVIPEENYQQLEVATKTQPFIDYGFRLLSKGRYSEYQVREKLYRREANKPTVDQVIDRLKQAHLLDDASLMKDWVQHYQSRGYGPRAIETKLFDKGFSKTLVTSIVYDEVLMTTMIKKIIDQALPNRRGLSQRALQESLKQKLLLRGFHPNQFLKLIDNLVMVEVNQEEAHLHMAIAKAKRLYQSRYQGKEYREKVINFLLRKGYNYSNIKRFIKESEDDD